MKFTERVRISTGLMCNIRCAFCYYNDELNTQSYSTETIKRMMDLAWDYNIKDIDFSGGEPTIRKDFLELVTYARHKGFRKICAITNGTRTNNIEYLKALHEAGLNELLVSIHGHNTTVHDTLVKRPGSFSKVIQTLNNLNTLKIRFRTNTVITSSNHQHLLDLAKLVQSYQPVAVNFICFNDWVNAASVTRQIGVRYQRVAASIKLALEYLDKYIPKVTIRYIPFCLMDGYEKHVCGLLQNDYDDDEWVDSVKRLITDIDSDQKEDHFTFLNEIWTNYRSELRTFLSKQEIELLNQTTSDNPFLNFPPHLAIIAHKIENFAKRKTYVKSAKCQKCSRNLICDGLEPAYASIFSTTELKVVPGDLITSSMFFREKYSANWR